MTDDTENSITDNIDSYMESIRDLNLVVLKLTTNEEVVGVFEEETKHSIKLIMPVRLMPTFYTIERWRPTEDDTIEGEREIDEDEDEDDSPFADTNKQMYELFNESSPEPQIFGRDDYQFQQQQHQILFSSANSKRLIAFYHMIDWFQHTNEALIEINKHAVISRALATDDLKHEYMGFLREKTKKDEFEIEQEYGADEYNTDDDPQFSTIELSESIFSPYQSKFVH